MRRAFVPLVLALSCARPVPPPVGYVLLHIDTDAPLPPGLNEVQAPTDPIPLFDRLRIEVIDPSATCDQCVEDLPLDRETMKSPGVSFAIVPPPGRTDIVVRVRMFRSAASVDGDPTPDGSVDVTATVPAVAEYGLVEQTLLLQTSTVGTVVGVGTPVTTTPGAPSSSQVGTWPGGVRTPCNGDPGPDEACIPGGAYWMGNPDVSGLFAGRDGNLQRVVILSPFFVDKTEVTAGAFRAAKVPGVVANWSGSTTGNSIFDYCTLATTPDPTRDPLPLNCAGWPAARAYCQSKGADLMTEAQFEYAAGGLGSHDYVWGDDDPRCSGPQHDAVLENAGNTAVTTQYRHDCQYPSTSIGGPMLPGTGTRDQLAVQGGPVVDLIGNLLEWTLDIYQPQDGPCWGTGVFTDPVCTMPQASADAGAGGGTERTVRGGGWYIDAFQARAALRFHLSDGSADFGLGFRCARPAK